MLELPWGRHIHMSLLLLISVLVLGASVIAVVIKADMTLITVYIIILTVF